MGLDEEQTNDRFNLKHRLFSKKAKQPRLALQNQNHNDADYRFALGKAGVCAPPAETPPTPGYRNILRGYTYFGKRLDELADQGGTGALFDFLNKLYAAVLVKMEVRNYSQAHTLFESLNNRGIPLTAIDLIKNNLLARMSDGEVDAAFDRWQALLGELGDDYAAQERFFRHHYNAFRAELKEVGREPLATGTDLVRIYERLIDRDAAGCLNRLCEAGRLYGRLLNPEEADPLSGPLTALERIQGRQSYQLLLRLLARQGELGLEDAQLARLIDRLTAFFVRRNLTDIPANRDLDRMFLNMIENAGGLKGDPLVGELARQLTEKSAPDEMFREKLEGPMYVENAGVTRFILCALEERAMTRETRRDLWAFKTRSGGDDRPDRRQYVWSIEHIFPQGENIPQPWVDMMAGGDREQAENLRRSHAHKLGNLTLSGYNSSLSNLSFAEKRDKKDASGNPLGYKNGLALNEDLKDAETWSAAQIDARTEKLVELTLALFPR